jgi:hypothetical protein
VMSLKHYRGGYRWRVFEIYIDNCCSWRRKLQEVFGHELEVKLDIFHAIKRVGEKISKKHRLRKLFMADWKLVFRDPSDRGESRKVVTPSPVVLEGNLDNFNHEWKKAEYNKQPILNDSVLKEMENIRVHMRKGCLSGIRPGCGTNRNEELHRNLNSVMSASRYGVELAYGLFTTFFFKHNEKKASKWDHRVANPIEFYKILLAGGPLTSEKFGLHFKEQNSGSPLKAEGLAISSCTFQAAFERINGTSAEHIRDKLQVIINEDDNLYEVAEFSMLVDDRSSTPVNCNDSNPDISFSVIDLKGILMKAVAWYFTSLAVNKLSDTAFINVLHIPFLAISQNFLCDPVTTELSLDESF